MLSPEIKYKERCRFHYSYSTQSNNIVTIIRQVKEIKGIKIGKEEVNLLLFADNGTLYVENPKKLTKKLLELTNAFSIVVGYKINIQNSNYISIHQQLAEQFKKRYKATIPFIVA